MKKWVGVLAVLFLATFASADTLTLVSAPYGVNGPYSLTLTSGTTTKTSPMICYSDNNTITYGQTWYVKAFSINTVNQVTGAFAGTTFQYNLLGYLADMLFANPGNTDIQNAIWAVLGTGGAQNQVYNDAVNWLNGHTGYSTTDLFYIPVDANGQFFAPGQGPQPMIVRAPEPGSILLLGAGLLGIAGFRKRKLAM